jgi:hypothetical protein
LVLSIEVIELKKTIFNYQLLRQKKCRYKYIYSKKYKPNIKKIKYKNKKNKEEIKIK